MQVVQITDLHLWTRPDDPRTRRYLDAGASIHPNAGDNLGALHAVLDDIARKAPGFDRLVVSGDIAQDEQRETYLMFRHLLEERNWLERALICPGNHDQREYLKSVFPELDCIGGFSDGVCGWRLIGIDTHDTEAKIGWDGNPEHLQGWGGGTGLISPEQLRWLEAELTAHADEPTLIFMHHPPQCPPHAQWLQPMLVEQPALDELTDVLASMPQLRQVHCGHIHYESWGLLQLENHAKGQDRHSALPVFTAPSTAHQQTPCAGDSPVVATLGEEAMAGWRKIECTEAGSRGNAWSARPETSVERVPFPASYDFEGGHRRPKSSRL